MSDQALNEQLQQQRSDTGQVRVWDVKEGKWKYVWGPDAREMIARGTASLTEPKAPVAEGTPPLDPDPNVLTVEKLNALDGNELHELAVKEGIKNIAKLGREELLDAIAKKHGIKRS